MVTSKEIWIETSDGDKNYKIDKNEGEYFFYKLTGVGFFSDDCDEIGKAKSIEDAITLCKIHATK